MQKYYAKKIPPQAIRGENYFQVAKLAGHTLFSSQAIRGNNFFSWISAGEM